MLIPDKKYQILCSTRDTTRSRCRRKGGPQLSERGRTSHTLWFWHRTLDKRCVPGTADPEAWHSSVCPTFEVDNADLLSRHIHYLWSFIMYHADKAHAGCVRKRMEMRETPKRAERAVSSASDDLLIPRLSYYEVIVPVCLFSSSSPFRRSTWPCPCCEEPRMLSGGGIPCSGNNSAENVIT